MSNLPDELWTRILELGVASCTALTYKDLCRLAITCRRLNRLSGDDVVWSPLLASDFPNNNKPPNSSSKAVYKIRFEKDRARKLLAHKRAILRVESQVNEHTRKLQEIQLQLAGEHEKMKTTLEEISELHKVRQASVALNVWQPQIIRGRQNQIVQHCSVPVNSRINALEMEIKLCKQQIAVLDKAYKNEAKRLESAKEQLTSIKYHPLQNFNLVPSSSSAECRPSKKKLKLFTK